MYFCIIFFSILTILALLSILKPKWVQKMKLEFYKEKRKIMNTGDRFVSRVQLKR